MPHVFHPQEQAILFDYFGAERPEALRAVDVSAPASPLDEDDPWQPVLVERNANGEQSAYGTANAVARLLLARIQARLPQWVAARKGEVVLSRRHRGAKSRQVDPLPQFLFKINWADSGPGFSWPEAYYVTYVPGFQRFVVTASFDGTDLFGYTDLAIGWFPEGTDVIPGSRRVLLEWWEEFHSRDYEAWVALLKSGLVSEAQALQWRNEVWPIPEEDEEEDDAPIEYSSGGIPIRAVTVVVKRSAIETGYPGGLVRFLERYPRQLQDEKLVGIVCKSTGDAEETVMDLQRSGVDIGNAGAVADRVLGPEWAAGGISFRCERPKEILDRGWRAFAVDCLPRTAAARRAMVDSFQEAITRRCDQVCANDPRPTNYAAGMSAFMRRAKIRDFLEGYVALHGRLPASENEVRGVGKVRF